MRKLKKGLEEKRKSVSQEISQEDRPPTEIILKSRVVGIGASAGGLEALRSLLAHLPRRSGMTFIVAQHLSPTHHSLLVELLARETSLPVKEISSGIPLKPDTIFITPPNWNVIVDKKLIHLEKPQKNHIPKPSVNQLFISLSQNFGSQAVGVVLSGTGQDGAEGIRAIKTAGGVTYSQEDSTAKYSGMPRSAFETGSVDFVLSPEQIADHLATLNNNQAHDLAPVEKSAFEQILTGLRRRTGYNFLAYKENSVRRRLAKRMATVQCKDLLAYREFINKRPEELDALANALLVSVTSFFRDKASFEFLGKQLEVIMNSKKNGDELRIWVPACATGQEAYSIAILVDEAMKRLNLDLRVQIFATDIDRQALEKARRGIFPSTIKQELPAQILKDHFSRVGQNFQISKRLREMIVYSIHDLIQDPPFLRLDLVSCRNVLIYIKPEVQKRVFAVFHFALRPGGYLFLGKSETPALGDAFFSNVNEQRRVFRRLEKVSRMPLTFSSLRDIPVSSKPVTIHRSIDKNPLEGRILQGIHESIIPAGILIDEQWRLQRVFGDVSPYLRIPSGEADFNLQVLLSRDLRLELRTLIGRVCRSGKAAVSEFNASNKKSFKIHAHIVPGAENEPRLIAIYFLPFPSINLNIKSVKKAGIKQKRQLVDLEKQLGATREHLQTVIEELETSNEELQSVNEELQASNEELQSTNEEFQTTNEELESTNEELTTVNEELGSKTHELKLANANLENVKDSIEFPLLVVDEQRRLTVWNPAAGKIFALVDESYMQSIFSLPSLVRMPNLHTLLDDVISKGKSKESEVGGQRHYILHIRPYRDGLNAIRGAVLVFFDDTDLRASQYHLMETAKKLKESERFAHSIIDSLPGNLCVLDQNGVIIAVNLSWRTFLQQNNGNPLVISEGANYLEVCEKSKKSGNLYANKVFEELTAILEGKKDNFEIEYPCHTLKSERWFLARFTAFKMGGPRRVIVTHDDITDRVHSEQTMKLQSRALDASHDGQIILSDSKFGNKIIYANRASELIFGVKKEQLMGTYLKLPNESGLEAQTILRAIANKEEAHVVLMWPKDANSSLWLDVSVSQVTEELNSINFTLLVFNDVTDLISSQSKVKDALDRESTAMAFAEVGTFDWNLSTGIIQNSEINLKLFGLDSSNNYVSFKTIREKIHPENLRDVEASVRNCLTGRGNLDIEIRLISNEKKEERWLHCRGNIIRKHGKPSRILGLVQDVTQRRSAEERVSYMARHDSLTGLPNRSFFRDRLSHAIAIAQRRQQKLALLFIDLDNFKTINDSLGHHIGDLLLQSVADRLSSTVRVTDTVARQAGDEYIVLLNGVRDVAEVSFVAEKILEKLSQPHFIQNHQIISTPSIGVSLYPDNGQSIEDLIKNADAAMYQVKINGRRGISFFTPEIQAEVQRRITIITDLRHASHQEQFFLEYQPQIDIRSGKWVGTEALLRWQHPVKGLLLPSSFIPIIEESEAISRLGEWVIRQACLECKKWNEKNNSAVPVAVNLAPQQLRQQSLLSVIESALKQSDLPPNLLELELTERALIRDPREASQLLKELREIGVLVSIDDFGTGYSSLSYLKKFTFDKLKIDRSFIDGLPGDPEDIAIVRTIIQLGKSLGISVIAEGVERVDQYEFLRNIGCAAVQGFLVSLPLSFEKMKDTLGSDIRPEICRVQEII